MTGLHCLPPAFRHDAIAFSILRSVRYAHQAFFSASTTRWSSSSSRRGYANALSLLDKLQSNRSVVASVSNAAGDMNQVAIPEMLEWTRKAGYLPRDFAKGGLKCIHVAGTKGKGSVCALTESILLQYRGDRAGDSLLNGKRQYLNKIGTYTSPHLMTVRERIRIDGSPISESLFTRYFFELWDRFSAVAPDSDPASIDTKPGYFRYLTILALHTFLQEGVETAIVECGIGGEYDSTNILPPEAVTVSAITRSGIDHVGMLGGTIEEIAWHKAGIMKTGVPAFTTKQVPAAQAALEKRAIEKGVKLEVVEPFKSGKGIAPKLKLGMEGDSQLDNASLAIPVAASHLRTIGITDEVPQAGALLECVECIPDRFRRGLESARLQGRFEARKSGNIEWLIDGAHTDDSVEAVGKWFIKKIEAAYQEGKPPTATMLIFNQQDRDADALIRRLMSTVLSGMRVNGLKGWGPDASRVFTHAAFCTNTPFKDEADHSTDLQRQESMARVYGGLDDNPTQACYHSVEEAVEFVLKVSEGEERVLALATGSLYLVGGLLKVLEKQATGRIAG